MTKILHPQTYLTTDSSDSAPMFGSVMSPAKYAAEWESDQQRFWRIEFLSWWPRWRGLLDARPHCSGIQIINLHHVDTDEEKKFRNFVNWLRERYTIISYAEAVRQIRCGEGRGPRLAITFDDGLYSHLAAAKILHDEQISACFFVCTGIVGCTDSNTVKRYCQERLRIEPTRFLNWDELQLIRDMKHDIGSHSVDHLDLAKLSPNALVDQIRFSRETLVHRMGGVEHFAWPYGRWQHFSAEGFRQVFLAGYSSCASCVRGFHATEQSIHVSQVCLRRDQTELSWPDHHNRYYLYRSRRHPVAASQLLPPDWI